MLHPAAVRRGPMWASAPTARTKVSPFTASALAARPRGRAMRAIYGGIASWCAHRKRSVGADVGIGPYSKDESQSVHRKRSGSAATRTRNARDLRRDCELVRSPQTLRRGRCLHRPEPAAGGPLPRRRSGSGYLSGSLNACDSVVGAAISRPELAAFGGSPPGSRSGKRAAISRPYDAAGSWCVRQRPSGIAAMRTRDARPYGGNWVRSSRNGSLSPLPIPRSIYFIAQSTAPPPWVWEAARCLFSLYRTR